MKKSLLLIGLIFSVLILINVIFPYINSDYIKSGKLYINEIMASNVSVYMDNDGDYSDYIEIYNGYNKKINLKDYCLSDSEYQTTKWKFPDISINPHEYLLVYASGKDYCNISERICHTNFKLSSNGETLTLTDNTSSIISKFSFEEQLKDISYGYNNGKYIYFQKATPGKKNDSKEYKLKKSQKYNIEITEYITHNKHSSYDQYGNYYDWIEIYNSSDEDYLLEKIYITDNEKNLKKYKLDPVNLKSKEYLVIYFAGEKTNYKNGIYADFSLSSNDKYIIISDGSNVFDKIDFISLPDNVSYGKINGKWKYFVTPTPGRENTTAGFEKIGGYNGSS